MTALDRIAMLARSFRAAAEDAFRRSDACAQKGQCSTEDYGRRREALILSVSYRSQGKTLVAAAVECEAAFAAEQDAQARRMEAL